MTLWGLAMPVWDLRGTYSLTFSWKCPEQGNLSSFLFLPPFICRMLLLWEGGCFKECNGAAHGKELEPEDLEEPFQLKASWIP